MLERIERIVRGEVLVPLLVVLLLSAGLYSCKKDEAPIGSQYTLTRDFLASNRFPIGTRWVYKDVAARDTFSLTLVQIDSTILQAGPGYNGYWFYNWGFSIQGDTTLIPVVHDTTLVVDSSQIDSLPVPVGRTRRVLPFDGLVAGTLLGKREQVLFFYDSTMYNGKQRQGLTFDGTRATTVPAGDFSQTYSFSGTGDPLDSLSAIELQWDPGQSQGPNLPRLQARGLLQFKTRSGRVFQLIMFRRP